MKTIHHIWAVVKYCADAIKKGAIVLYLVIKSDVEYLCRQLLKIIQTNKQEDSSAGAPHSAKNHFAQHATKAYPQHWSPHLKVWWSAKVASAILN